MTCLPNWTVLYPILYLESSSRTSHAGFRNEDAVNESAPYPELQEGSPDYNPDGRVGKCRPFVRRPVFEVGFKQNQNPF